MKYLLTSFAVVITFIVSTALYAQNLVPNPDFSLVFGCPGAIEPPLVTLPRQRQLSGAEVNNFSYSTKTKAAYKGRSQ